MEDIPLWPKTVPTICIHCDDQAAVSREQNLVYNDKSKHICRGYNIVRQLHSNGVISIDFVKSKDNLADPFTKDLSGERISCALKGMGLKA